MISIPKDFAYVTSIFSRLTHTRNKTRWEHIQKRFVDWKTTANNNGIMVFYAGHDVFLELLKSNTLVQPSLLNLCARISWLLSRWRTRMTVDIWD